MKHIKLLTKLILDGLFINKKFRRLFDFLISYKIEQVDTVVHNNITLNFSTPNELTLFRSRTFSSKEPETLNWIESMDAQSVLWDIGANIGIYSCYAAKFNKMKVYSFEPSVFNLEFLARNIMLNGIVEYVTVIPLAVNEVMSIGQLNMSNTQWGGALSSYDKEFGYDGNRLNTIFAYNLPALSIDDFVNIFNIPCPSHIKIDVDGIEHLILNGGANVLKQTSSLLIEVNQDFSEQYSAINSILQQAGLNLDSDFYWQEEEQKKMNRTHNQIWCRK